MKNCQHCKFYELCRKKYPKRSHHACKFYKRKWWAFWAAK